MAIQNSRYTVYLSDLKSSLYLSLRLLVLALVVVFSAQQGAFSLGIACTVLAALFWLLDRKQSIDEPASLLLGATGLLLGVAGLLYSSDPQPTNSVLAPIPIGVTFIYYLAYTLIKKPFAEHYAKVTDLPRFRFQISWLWIIGYGFSLAMLLLIPQFSWAKAVLFTVLPFFTLGHFYIQLKGINGLWNPPAVRKIGKCRFIKVKNTKENLRPIYALYLQELLPQVFDEEHKLRNIPFEQFVEERLEKEKDSWDHIEFIGAYRDDELVGCISCQYDRPGEKMPFETETTEPRSLDKLRAIGEIVEARKFCVKPKYRLNLEIMAGVLITSIEWALARGTTFMIVQAIPQQTKLYSHLGFKQVTESVVTNLEYDAEVNLMIRNFAHEAEEENALTRKVKEYMSPYVISRVVYQQTLSTLFAGGNRITPPQVSNDDLPNMTAYG